MSTAPNTGSENSLEPDPRAVAEVVDHISRNVEYAGVWRSHICEAIRIGLDGIHLLSAWEDPVPGADRWVAAAKEALETAKSARWTPPPLGARAGDEDVQALSSFFEAIPRLRPAVDALWKALAPLDVRIATRCIIADFARGAPDTDVLDQIQRATGIPRTKLAWRGGDLRGGGYQWRGDWLAAAWEATKSDACFRATNLRKFLKKAIRKNKQKLDVEYGKPRRLGAKDLDDLEIGKRAATRLDRGKLWERRRRAGDAESTLDVEYEAEHVSEYYDEREGQDECKRDDEREEPTYKWMTMHGQRVRVQVCPPGEGEDVGNRGPTVKQCNKPELSKWHHTKLEGMDLLLAIEQTSQRLEVLEKYRDEEASQIELEFLEAIFRGAETTKEVLDATGGEAYRSKFQAFRRKLNRRLERD